MVISPWNEAPSDHVVGRNDLVLPTQANRDRRASVVSAEQLGVGPFPTQNPFFGERDAARLPLFVRPGEKHHLVVADTAGPRNRPRRLDVVANDDCVRGCQQCQERRESVHFGAGVLGSAGVGQLVIRATRGQLVVQEMRTDACIFICPLAAPCVAISGSRGLDQILVVFQCRANAFHLELSQSDLRQYSALRGNSVLVHMNPD